MIHLKTCLVYLTSYFMKNFRRKIIVRTDKNDSLTSERKRQKKTQCQMQLFFYNAFRCISNSNIDKNFSNHNNSKLGGLSHDVTVCLIWNTRSPHYNIISCYQRHFPVPANIRCFGLVACFSRKSDVVMGLLVEQLIIQKICMHV